MHAETPCPANCKTESWIDQLENGIADRRNCCSWIGISPRFNRRTQTREARLRRHGAIYFLQLSFDSTGGIVLRSARCSGKNSSLATHLARPDKSLASTHFAIRADHVCYFQGVRTHEVTASAAPDSALDRCSVCIGEEFFPLEFRRIRIDIAIIVMNGKNIIRREGASVFRGPDEILPGSALRIHRKTGGISAVEALIVPAGVEDADPVETRRSGGVEDFFCGQLLGFPSASADARSRT